ncbi:MAG: hypothetical protein CSB55_01850 [Candidatus Cloacimonadota bacterium]|nr:MAG: hypothetical protein CSB55_01850 [Candidatus Cloacimonadota bacterium]
MDLKLFKGKLNFPVITTGTFDGLHLGHLELLTKVIKIARENNGESIVLTYYHHPLETLRSKTYPYLLTEKNKKKALIKSFGIDYVFFLNFDQKTSQMSPRDFLENILIDKLGAKVIVAGYDTHFGKNREGNLSFLKNNETAYGYKTVYIPPFEVKGKIVSSSFLREIVSNGKIEDVFPYLGRFYSINGYVIKGHKIGRTLGFPTINVKPHDPNKLYPRPGVYFTLVCISGKFYYSLTNIGFSPTLKNMRSPEIESHLLNFSGILYGKETEIFFLEKIREEIKFSNRDKLIKQLQNDLAWAEKKITETGYEI